jgi:divalent metal cation (Fe/Co/Zn/Cd) transporter
MTALVRGRGSTSLAVLLLWLTVAWNVVEGFIAVGAGIVAGSVALIGFGLDSFIEVAAAGILLWRLRLSDEDERAESRERVAHQIVGVTFIVLSVYIFAQTGYVLATGNEPESSSVGLVLAIVSLMVMPAIGVMKRWNAMRIGSRALIAESTETLVCAYLSLTLFIGLGAHIAFGWWWADVAAALSMVPWIAKEGLEGLRGESCEDDCA